MPFRSCSPFATCIPPPIPTEDQSSYNLKHPKRCPTHLSVSLRASHSSGPGPVKYPTRLAPRLSFDRQGNDLANVGDFHLNAKKWFERSNRNAAGNRVVSLSNGKRQIYYEEHVLTAM